MGAEKVINVFKCPRCREKAIAVDHDYTVKAYEKVIIGVDGNFDYGTQHLGDTVDGVYRCLTCNYEGKTLAEFMKE